MKASIFIVEDSFIVSFHLQKTLETEGYTVVATADSGEQALEKLRQCKPDIVLMDIMLNGAIDGIETACRIRDLYQIPVVYLSALTDKETIQRAKITGPYGYIMKPFEDREIFTAIEMTLYRHEMESASRKSQEQLYSILHSISDAVVSIDTDFRIVFMNPCAEVLTGCKLNDVVGRSFFEVFDFSSEDTTDFNPIQCSIRCKHNAISDNLIIRSKAGVEIPVGEGSTNPTFSPSGNFSGLVITFRDVSVKKERDKLRAETERSLLAAVIKGQENERSRVAKDLHDGLGQLLTVIKMKVNLFMQESVESADLNKLLGEALVETKKISENLLPSKLRDFDLSTCLKSLCNQLNTSTNTTISFDSFGLGLSLDELLKVNLYRIAQEGITNALKHGNAHHVHVQLNEDVDVLQLTIEDDGVGLSEKKAEPTSNGLINMRDRTKVMNGKFLIESDKNRGTIIMVEVPVHQVTR